MRVFLKSLGLISTKVPMDGDVFHGGTPSEQLGWFICVYFMENPING
jgi:hypothetical protein